MLTALLKTMRPRQWTKNIFVFAALVFDKQLFHADAFLRTLATRFVGDDELVVPTVVD